MSELGLLEKFWNEVVPECVSGLEWASKIQAVKGEKLKKSLKVVIVELDDGEFDLFMAQVVIKGSGKGIVGAELSAIVEWFKGLRG